MNYKVINTEYLDSVSGGDNEIVHEIIELFKEQAVEIYNDMNLLLAENDFHSLGMLAHKAKSSVSIMGMSNLADMLKTFELEARVGKDTGKYESYIARFGEETKSAITELDDYISNRLKKS